jgi:4-amino-4-deoxy-L-arabinose transferase-like glycosyltransferase
MHTKTKKKGGSAFSAMYECMAILVLVRCFAWLNTVIISRDSTRYVALAKLWMAWKPFKALAHNYHPLYPFLIAVAAKTAGVSLEHAALGLSLLASVLTVPALVIFFLELGNRRIAFLGVLFFCISPYFIRFSADILTEPVFLLFMAWGVAFIVKSQGRNATRLYLLLAGLSIGLAYLTRPEGLVLLAVYSIWQVFFSGRRAFKKSLLNIIILCVGTILIASPYVIYLHRDSGTWLLTRKKRVGTLISELSIDKKKTSRKVQAETLQLPAAFRKKISKKRAQFLINRKRWQQDQANKIRRSLGERKSPSVHGRHPILSWLISFFEAMGVVLVGYLDGMFYPIAIWVVFRFVALKRFRWNRWDTFVAIFSVIFILILSVLLAGYGYVSRRHYSSMVMLWFAWAGSGFIYFSEMAGAYLRKWRVSPKTIGTVFLIAIISISIFKGTWPYRTEKSGRKIIGRWIAQEEQGVSSVSIVSSMSRIAYYAGAKWISLKMIDEKTVNALRRHEISYVVLSAEEMKKSNILKMLLKKYGFKTVYRYTSPVGKQDITVFSYKKMIKRGE